MINLPGYDAWKLMSPDEDHVRRGGKICPHCDAWLPGPCGMDDEAECQLEEPDPDYLYERERDRRAGL